MIILLFSKYSITNLVPIAHSQIQPRIIVVNQSIIVIINLPLIVVAIINLPLIVAIAKVQIMDHLHPVIKHQIISVIKQ